MDFWEAAEAANAEQHVRQPDPDWRRVPHEVLPTPLPLSAVLATGRDVALVVSALEVYPTGFAFTLRAARHPEAPGHDHDLHADMSGFDFPNAGPGRMRLGLAYPDGRAATNAWPPDHGGGPGSSPGASLWSLGGGGSADGSEARYWAWPLPAIGDVDLVVAWPVRDIPETRLTLSGDLLRAAAATATPIWG